MGTRTSHSLAFGARWVGLILAVAAGATLRFDGLAVPSLWLDEILGYELTTAAQSRPRWSWLTGLEAEHGPLYYATQMAGRLLHGVELETRVAPALIGTATVVLIWFAAKEVAGATAAFCAAALLATSPLHVYYSREGRPYALAMMLAAALLFATIRAPRAVPWLVLAAVYTSATALPLALGAAVAFVAVRRSAASLAAAVPLAFALFLYRGERPPPVDVRFPSLDAAFLDSLIRAFGVTATGSPERGNTAYVLFALAVGGIVILVRRRKFPAVILFVVPIVVALAALALTDHWFAVRYVSPALPAYVVLVSVAVEGIVRAAGRKLPPPLERWASPALVAGIVTALANQTVGAARTEAHQKLNWRKVADTIWRHAHPGDVVATAEQWSAVSLSFYLDRLPKRVRLRPLTYPYERAWLVTAGYSPSGAARDSLCRHPLLLASELEGFRLHYAPSVHDFLRHRSTAAELNAIVSARGGGFALHMGRENDVFLGAGWSQPEGTSRWAAARHAEVLVIGAAAGDRAVRVRVSPLTHRSLPPQTMAVALNGAPVAEAELSAGWNDLRFEASSSRWRRGVNVLRFTFSRANAPRALDPSLSDPRQLAAMFESIAVEEASPAASPPFYVRLQDLVDEESVWFGHATRLDVEAFNRRNLDRLVSRLGFDPAVLVPRILAREIALEDVLASTALLGGCEDARTFVQRFWHTVFEKPPNAIEERVLLSILARAPSRADFARQIARMSEFRARVGG